MATTTISSLTAVTAANLTGAAVMEVEDSAGATRQSTLATLRTKLFAGSTGYTATDPLVAGLITGSSGIKSGSGSVLTSTGVATTLFSIPGAGLYLVFAYLSGVGNSAFTAYALVSADGGGTPGQALLRTDSGGASFTLTLSGGDVKITQSSGGSFTVSYAYSRLV